MNKKFPIDNIIPFEDNPKNHPKKQVEDLAKWIDRIGFIQPIVVDKNNIIIMGHARYAAAKLLDFTEAEEGIAYSPPKSKILPVIRLENMSCEEIIFARIFDNEINERGHIIMEKVYFQLQPLSTEFQKLSGFNMNKLKSKFEEKEEVGIDTSKPPVSKLGDLYKLGNHFLLCGDSTNPKDVEKLMKGKMGNMIFTDPPYGVNYSDKNKMLNKFSKANRIEREIQNDNLSTIDMESLWFQVFKNYYDFTEAKCPIYVCSPSGALYFHVIQSLLATSWMMKQEIIWVKNNHVLGRSDYHCKHEPIIYGWKKGGTHEFYGGSTENTVWNYDKPHRSSLHPTMKPVELIQRAIINSSKKGDIVLDFFGGSGSTLMACETLERNCYTMELEPIYVDAIIKRWQDYTGNEALKIDYEK